MSGKTIQMALGRKGVVSDDSMLGQEAIFQGVNLDDPNNPILDSSTTIKAILVANDSGGTLASGLGVTYKSGYLGKKIGALSGANAVCDGVVDPFLGAGVTVADGETFWLCVEGRFDVEVGAGDLAANGVVQTLANGKFGTGTAGTNPIGHCGKANEAGTSGGRALVAFNNPFSAIKPCC
jgi:hypothetical protein